MPDGYRSIHPHPNNRDSHFPSDLYGQFVDADLDHAWDYLQKKFNINSKKWREEFDTTHAKVPKGITKSEFFYYYGKMKLQPSLNLLLYRDPDYPTWDKFVRYIVNKKNELPSARQSFGEL